MNFWRSLQRRDDDFHCVALNATLHEGAFRAVWFAVCDGVTEPRVTLRKWQIGEHGEVTPTDEHVRVVIPTRLLNQNQPIFELEVSLELQPVGAGKHHG
jgi:hypothetical protein